MASEERLQRLIDDGKVWFAAAPDSAAKRAVVSAEHCPLRALFDIDPIDRCLGDRGFSFGAVHEWALDLSFPAVQSWYPPLIVVVSLLGTTVRRGTAPVLLLQQPLIAWVGRRCWPMPRLLEQTMSAGAHWNWRQ